MFQLSLLILTTFLQLIQDWFITKKVTVIVLWQRIDFKKKLHFVHRQASHRKIIRMAFWLQFIRKSSKRKLNFQGFWNQKFECYFSRKLSHFSTEGTWSFWWKCPWKFSTSNLILLVLHHLIFYKRKTLFLWNL